MDAIIVDEAAKALMARVNVVPVTYDTPGLWRDFGSTRLSDVVRKNVTPAAVDAYVVVWPIFEAGVLIGDPLGGITLFNNDGLVGTTTTLSTSFEMTVLDGQTFQQLASRQVSYPFGPNDLELMISIDVDRSLWADTYEILTADQKIKIQAILKVMLQNEIPATLMGMGMAR